MRTLKLEEGTDVEVHGQGDWKEEPNDVLEQVDVALEEHDLEVIILDFGDDTYSFRIERRGIPLEEIEAI